MITKQALGGMLWGMADILRDSVTDYKSYILPLLFFKRLSDNFRWETQNALDEFKAENGREPSDKEMRIITKERHDFTIPEGCFWEDVRNAPSTQKNEILWNAVSEIAECNKDRNGKYILKGIIDAAKWNEPAPDGSGGKRLSPEVLTALVSYLDAVDLSNKNVNADILGDAYEYLIKRFADENKGGTTAGQFYTAPGIVDIIVRYLKPQKGDTIYDPTCGSGGFLINSAKYVQETCGSQKAVRLFGQEYVWNTWAICNINMILHGLDAKIEQGDTILEPKFKSEGNDLVIRTFDKVMANFPFSEDNWGKNGEPKIDKKGNKVLKNDGNPQMVYTSNFTDPYNRLIYGTPPNSNGDFAFIQHIIASLDENGKAGVVCPQGVLFRGQPEKTEEEDGQNRKADDEYLIRRGLLRGLDSSADSSLSHNIIDAIVVLPNNLFYGTTIPGSILFINKNKPEERKNKVLMVYAAKEGWYKEEANMNILLPQDILRISTILESWGDIEVAKPWIASQKERLRGVIQDNLDFKLTTIEEDFGKSIIDAKNRLDKAKKTISDKVAEKKKPTKSDTKELQTAQNMFDKLVGARDTQIADANALAEKERTAIDEVENELIKMLQTPELRKRYFAVVDMDEIEENEYNLNIPRYVDTFEPEKEIDLKEAITEFQECLSSETEASTLLNNLLKLLHG